MFEIIYLDDTIDYKDYVETDVIIHQLETGMRFDVNQISEVDDYFNVVKTVWTEEEGLIDETF